MMGILGFPRKLARAYPLSIATAIQVLVLSLFLWSIASFGTVDVTDGTGQPDISFVLEALNTEATLAIILLCLIGLLGWGKACRLTTPVDWQGLKWAAPLVGIPTLLAAAAIALILIESSQVNQVTIIWKLALFSLAVGVFEETLYRGTLYHGLSQHLSPSSAMLLSSAVFGMFHMQNIFVGQAIDATAFQSLNAFALGVLFCAVMLQTNSIWWAIALHAAWDVFLFTSAYISQSQPELIGITTDDQAVQSPEIVPAAFLLPAFFLGLGLFIFVRWTKRTQAAT